MQKKELCPTLHLGIVANEKGAFGSPSTKVANLLIFVCLPYFHFRGALSV